jgi:hypothetical protein
MKRRMRAIATVLLLHDYCLHSVRNIAMYANEESRWSEWTRCGKTGKAAAMFCVCMKRLKAGTSISIGGRADGILTAGLLLSAISRSTSNEHGS